MADELKIVIKAILDEQDLKNQSKGIKGVEIPGRIVIDKADLKKQIDSVAGESAKFGNKFTIKYGVDKTHFVKQFKDAGEAAKREIEKVVGSSGGIQIATKIDTNAVRALEAELGKIGFDKSSIKAATQGLEEQRIKVKEIATSYESVAQAQTGLQSITIKGVDAQNKQVTLVQRFNAESKDLEKTQIRVVAKLNEQGEIIGTMATKLRAKDTETIKAEEVEVLKRFVSNVQQANQYSGEMKNTVDALGVSLDNAFAEPELKSYQNQLGIAQQQFRALKAEADRLAASPVTTINTNTASLSKSLAYQGMDAQTSGVTALRNEMTSLISEYGRLKVSMDALDPSSDEFQNLATQVDALDTRFKSATKAAEVFNGSFGANTKLTGVAEQINKAKSSLDVFESKWSKFKSNPALLAEFEKLRDAAKDLDATNLQNFNKQMATFGKHVEAAGVNTRSFGDELKNALSKFGIWITASTIFMQAWRGIRQMVDSVKELDAALVEFNKVADLSNAELNKFVDRAFAAGKALGRTGTEVIQASAIFKQAGYDIEESLSLSNSALVMKNVSENIDSTATAASDLISVMKGFDMAVSDSMSIIDMINNVSNNLPVSFGAIDEGLTRVSGTLAQTGTSIQETIGLLTGGFASLRNMEKVSAGLIQISQRLRGVGEDGEAIDGLAPKLQSMFKEIAGVDIQDTNGQLRSTYDIIVDLAKVADDLSSKEKQLLFEKAAGNKQVAVLNAIVSNIEDVNLAVNKATNSTDSALKENEKFLDSIQGKTNQLASSLQLLANNTIESGFIKGLIDFSNNLVALIDKLGLLPSLLAGLSLFTTMFSGGKITGALSSFAKSLVGIPSSLKTMTGLFKISKTEVEGFGNRLAYAGVKASTTQLTIAGLSIAIAALNFALSEHKKSLAEQSERASKAIASWKEMSATLANNKAAIDDIGSDYEKLSDGVDSYGNNISLTAEEFSKYQRITAQVANMFPELINGYTDQGTAIVNLADGVKDLSDAYLEAEASAHRAALAGASDVFKVSNATVSSRPGFLGSWGGQLGDSAEIGIKPLADMAREVKSDLEQYGAYDWSALLSPNGIEKTSDKTLAEINKIFETLASEAGLSLGYKLGTPVFSEEDVELNIRLLESYLSQESAKLDAIANNRKPFIKSFLFGEENYQSLSNESKNIIDSVVSNLSSEYVNSFDTPGELFADVETALLNPLSDNQGFYNNVNAVKDMSSQFKAGKISVDEYSGAYSNFINYLSESGLSDEIIDAVKKMTLDPKSFGNLVNNVKEKLPKEFSDKIGTLSLGQLKIAADLQIEDGSLLSWQQFLDLIKQVNAVSSSLTIGERIGAIASAATLANTAFAEQTYSASITVEQYNKLAEAGEDYVQVVDNTNGYLSINKQKLDALILSKREEEKANIAVAKAASQEKFDENTQKLATQAEYIELLILTKDKLGDSYDGLNDKAKLEYDALVTSQEAIRKEISALDLEASALDYATSAYKRWLDAKNGPEADDAYNELSVAKKAIEDGLASGRVGTEEFKAAVALLVPEEISAENQAGTDKYAKAISAYLTNSLSGYLTEDSKGINKFIEDLADKGFLEQADDGKYSTTATANIEDIAKALNITKETAEQMFTALKAYGWEVDLVDGMYDSAEATQKYADATKALAEAQEKLNEAKKSGAGTAEIKELEQGVTNAQTNVDKLNQTEIKPPISIEEQLLAELAVVQDALNKLLINIPAKLNPDLAEDIKEIQASLDTDKSLIATAIIDGNPKLLEERLANLTSPTDENGNPKTSIQISIDAKLTELYDSALKIVNDDIAKVNSATPSVKPYVDPDTKEVFISDLAALQNGPYAATITIDGNADKFKEEAEKARLWLEEEFPIPPSVLWGGSGYQPTQEELAAHQLEFGKQGEGEYYGETLIKDYQDAKETIEADPIKPRIDLDDVEVSLAETLGTITGANPKIVVGADVIPGLADANGLVDDINLMEATITVKSVYDGRGGDLNLGNYDPNNQSTDPLGVLPKPRHAKGTKKTKRGVALTGEEGTETVLTKDGFYTVGDNGPELVNLQGGEEIFNADETKKLFSNSKNTVSGQSFAPGTGFLSSFVNSVKASIKKTVDATVATTKKALKAATALVATGYKAPEPEDNKKTGGGRSTQKEEVKEEVKTDFEDWIPRLLDNVRKQTDKYIASSEKQVTYAAQNSELDKAIGNNTKLAEVNMQANARYLQQANQVAASGGLSGDIISKIQNGAIDIQLYDENTRKVIADYQTWYDLAQKTLDTITDIEGEQKKLAMSKLDNIQKYYENRNSMYGNRIDIASSTLELGQSTGRETKRSDYDGMLNDVNAQLGILRAERSEYERTFTALVASGVIKSGSTDWYNYTARIQDMDKSIIQASQSLDQFNDLADAIAVNNLNVAIRHLNTVQSTLESVQGLRQAQGRTLDALDYEQLVSVGMQQISLLEGQNAELVSQQEGLDVLSTAYQDIQGQIEDNLNGIWNIKTSQEGWNDAITDLNIAQLQRANEQYNRQLETMTALEDLEKAKQRRNLVYRDGRGFGYEADPVELLSAQQKVNQVNVDNLITALEDSKADDNVYDSTGGLLGKLFTGLDGVDFGSYASSALNGNENSALLADAIRAIDWSSIKNAASGTNNVEFSGGINLYGVNDVATLADSIQNFLGGYITQGMFDNT